MQTIRKKRIFACISLYIIINIHYDVIVFVLIIYAPNSFQKSIKIANSYSLLFIFYSGRKFKATQPYYESFHQNY